MFLMVEIKEPQLRGPCMVLLGFPSKSVEERQRRKGRSGERNTVTKTEKGDLL